MSFDAALRPRARWETIGQLDDPVLVGGFVRPRWSRQGRFQGPVGSGSYSLTNGLRFAWAAVHRCLIGDDWSRWVH